MKRHKDSRLFSPLFSLSRAVQSTYLPQAERRVLRACDPATGRQGSCEPHAQPAEPRRTPEPEPRCWARGASGERGRRRALNLP